MKQLILLTTLALSLGACANPYDTQLYEDYTVSHDEHITQEAERIQAQAQAIQETAQSYEGPSEAKAIITFAASQEIAKLKPTKYDVDAPTLSTDVQTVAVEAGKDIVVSGVPWVAAVRLADKLAEGDNVQSNGGDIHMEKTEVHTTVAGEANSTSSGYSIDKSNDNSIKPTVQGDED